jgi:acyl carrier protein
MADGGASGQEARIFRIVRQTLPAGAGGGELRPDQSLQEAGLKSLDMVTLMLAVEAEFDLEIPQQAMTPENFQSVDAIGRLVASLAAQA